MNEQSPIDRPGIVLPRALLGAGSWLFTLDLTTVRVLLACAGMAAEGPCVSEGIELARGQFVFSARALQALIGCHRIRSRAAIDKLVELGALRPVPQQQQRKDVFEFADTTWLPGGLIQTGSMDPDRIMIQTGSMDPNWIHGSKLDQGEVKSAETQANQRGPDPVSPGSKLDHLTSARTPKAPQHRDANWRPNLPAILRQKPMGPASPVQREPATTPAETPPEQPQQLRASRRARGDGTYRGGLGGGKNAALLPLPPVGGKVVSQATARSTSSSAPARPAASGQAPPPTRRSPPAVYASLDALRATGRFPKPQFYSDPPAWVPENRRGDRVELQFCVDMRVQICSLLGYELDGDGFTYQPSETGDGTYHLVQAEPGGRI